MDGVEGSHELGLHEIGFFNVF